MEFQNFIPQSDCMEFWLVDEFYNPPMNSKTKKRFSKFPGGGFGIRWNSWLLLREWKERARARRWNHWTFLHHWLLSNLGTLIPVNKWSITYYRVKALDRLLRKGEFLMWLLICWRRWRRGGAQSSMVDDGKFFWGCIDVSIGNKLVAKMILEKRKNGPTL